MKVWKVGSRWGKTGRPDTSIIDLFRKYQIVFVGKAKSIFGKVKIGDLIAVSEGKTVVAVAKVIGEPKVITEFRLDDHDKNSGRFAYEDWVSGCKVKMYDLEEEDCFSYNMGAFHAVHNEYKTRVTELYKKYVAYIEEQGRFSIDAKTCTLKSKKEGNENVIFDGKTKYIIPVYQRPYSWSEKQITKLLSDIFSSFYGYDKMQTAAEPIFIGTMQLSAKKKGAGNQPEQEIIDGQQRITSLIILLNELKKQFPGNAILQKTDLNVLETRVNKEEQNKYWQKYLKSNEDTDEDSSLNKYAQNGKVIRDYLQAELSKEGEEEDLVNFDANKFIKYLLSEIYFVVIETQAGLSKTLQIFDAINTTGLDLNGSDVFKIRMYEYLQDKKGEEVFDEISELYAKTDKLNEEQKANVNFAVILDLYQKVIVTKAKLPNTLYESGTNTFFDRLFDTVFNINTWANFNKEKLDSYELTTEKINELIDARFKWQQIGFKTPEQECAMHFIWWSRYGRYWYLVSLFTHRFKNNNESLESELAEFTIQLSKLFVVYSIKHKKSVNKIKNFVYRLIKAIVNSDKSSQEIIEMINIKKGEEVNNLDELLSFDLTHNAKRKNLICRLSAMLAEDYKVKENDWKMKKRIFDRHIDIEHINSYNDKDLENRDKIKAEWGKELNSLGNLVVLERTINRSIGNHKFSEKLKQYKNSEFPVIKKLIEGREDWEVKDSEERREVELKKIKGYLFS